MKEIKAEYFIDASQDADLAVLAGAPYFKGGADIGLAGPAYGSNIGNAYR